MSSPTCRATGSAGSHARAAARAGAYRRETLAARFGEMALPDVLIALTRRNFIRQSVVGRTSELPAGRPRL
jgi:hypothetical protein